jgi:hypothetical protein
MKKENNNTEIRKLKREYESENFVNIYIEWEFFRTKEYSAVLISKLRWYKLYLNICKQSNLVFLECGFPNISLFETKSLLKELWYNYRIYWVGKNINKVYEEMNWWNEMVEKDKEELLTRKRKMLKWEVNG